MGKSRVIGLDIGTTHVRAAEIEFGSDGPQGKGQPELVRYGQVVLPHGAVRDSEVAEAQTVASALRQLWAEAKFSRKDVVIGVGNQRVLVRDLDLPSMPLPQLRAALPFQVQDMIPVAVEDALLDYYPTTSTVGPNGPLVRGLLVAATKETVLANTRAVELAGLRPVMVDLNAFALARVQARGAWSEGVFAFIDIGARVTNLVIVARGVPRFVRILASGGQDVTDAVAASDPLAYVATATKKFRKGRIFIDYLRNGRGATSVASFSLRAREGAPVAMPLRWEELGRIKGGDAYTLTSTPRRMGRLRAHPWGDYGRRRQDLASVSEALSALEEQPVPEKRRRKRS